MGRASRGAEELFYGEEIAGEVVSLDGAPLGDRGILGIIDDLGVLLQQDPNPRSGEPGGPLLSKDRNYTFHDAGEGDKRIQLDLAESEAGFVLEVIVLTGSRREVVYSGVSATSAVNAARSAAESDGVPGWDSFSKDEVYQILEGLYKSYSR